MCIQISLIRIWVYISQKKKDIFVIGGIERIQRHADTARRIVTIVIHGDTKTNERWRCIEVMSI